MTPRSLPAWLVVVALATGCGARFVDLRPPSDDLAAAPADLAGADLAGDAAPAVLARGTFVGRQGHSGAGAATLVDGAVELGDDFSVSPVPGPVLVLTARASLGTQIDAGDLEIGPLSQPAGAQRYAIPADGGRRNLFVFCKPFGVEVALAVLQ